MGKSKTKTNHYKIIPLRLEGEILEQLESFHRQTGLSRSFIIRHSLGYALKKFKNHEASILTMEDGKP